MKNKNTFTDSDLLYAMIECLDYEAFQYGNDAEWYAQGEYHDIKRLNAITGVELEPYGVKDLERFENEKPKGFWKVYI